MQYPVTFPALLGKQRIREGTRDPCMEVKAALVLNLPLTKSKRERLRDFKDVCREVPRFTASVMPDDDIKSSTNLH